MLLFQRNHLHRRDELLDELLFINNTKQVKLSSIQEILIIPIFPIF